MIPLVSWYTCCVRTQRPLGRMYSYFGNQGISRQKSILCEKEVLNFHEFHTAGVLVGLSYAVKNYSKL